MWRWWRWGRGSGVEREQRKEDRLIVERREKMWHCSGREWVTARDNVVVKALLALWELRERKKWKEVFLSWDTCTWVKHYVTSADKHAVVNILQHTLNRLCLEAIRWKTQGVRTSVSKCCFAVLYNKRCLYRSTQSVSVLVSFYMLLFYCKITMVNICTCDQSHHFNTISGRVKSSGTVMWQYTFLTQYYMWSIVPQWSGLYPLWQLFFKVLISHLPSLCQFVQFRRCLSFKLLLSPFSSSHCASFLQNNKNVSSETIMYAKVNQWKLKT